MTNPIYTREKVCKWWLTSNQEQYRSENKNYYCKVITTTNTYQMNIQYITKWPFKNKIKVTYESWKLRKCVAIICTLQEIQKEVQEAEGRLASFRISFISLKDNSVLKAKSSLQVVFIKYLKIRFMITKAWSNRWKNELKYYKVEVWKDLNKSGGGSMTLFILCVQLNTEFKTWQRYYVKRVIWTNNPDEDKCKSSQQNVSRSVEIYKGNNT